jgi:hypothetical protein
MNDMKNYERIMLMFAGIGLWELIKYLIETYV